MVVQCLILLPYRATEVKSKTSPLIPSLKLIQGLKYIFQLVFYDFDKIIPMIRSFLDVASLWKRLMNLLYADSLHYIRSIYSNHNKFYLRKAYYFFPPTLIILPPFIFNLVIPSAGKPSLAASSPTELDLERLRLSSKQKWLLTLVL